MCGGYHTPFQLASVENPSPVRQSTLKNNEATKEEEFNNKFSPLSIDVNDENIE